MSLLALTAAAAVSSCGDGSCHHSLLLRESLFFCHCLWLNHYYQLPGLLGSSVWSPYCAKPHRSYLPTTTPAQRAAVLIVVMLWQ